MWEEKKARRAAGSEYMYQSGRRLIFLNVSETKVTYQAVLAFPFFSPSHNNQKRNQPSLGPGG